MNFRFMLGILEFILGILDFLGVRGYLFLGNSLSSSGLTRGSLYGILEFSASLRGSEAISRNSRFILRNSRIYLGNSRF